MPGFPAVTVVTNSCVYLHFTREAAGASAPGITPRPLLGGHKCKTRAIHAAGSRTLVIASEAKQSSFLNFRK
jgi:hypothetical protein